MAPLKAANTAGTIVYGSATLEASAVTESTARAMVMGKGIILEDELLRVVVIDEDVLLPVLDWQTPLTAIYPLSQVVEHRFPITYFPVEQVEVQYCVFTLELSM